MFSFYGDVERVKMMTRRSVCALVEFSTATFACIARDYLDQVGSTIGLPLKNATKDVCVLCK